MGSTGGSERGSTGALVLVVAAAVIAGTMGAVAAQPAANGTNVTHTTNTTNTTDTTSTANTTAGAPQLAPDFIVRSAADLRRVAETAPDGANVFVPANTTITVEPDEIVFEQDDLALYSAGGRFGEGGGTVRLGGDESGATITIEGNNATVTGLRLIGPNPNTIYGESGPDLPNSFGILTQGDNTTVYNAEIAGYTHAGIQFREVEGGRVYFSSIHHNTSPNLGYGVSSWSSSPLIQYNYFDANRHSIQTVRNTESGYRAEGNVVGPRRPNHAFDVHSASSTEPAYGGERVEIVNNTFLPPSNERDRSGEVMGGPPITVDGRFGPVEGALIANNAFVGIERGTAVYQAEENGSQSESFASDADPTEFNNIRLRGNSYADSRAAVPPSIGAPASLPPPSQVSGILPGPDSGPASDGESAPDSGPAPSSGPDAGGDGSIGDFVNGWLGLGLSITVSSVVLFALVLLTLIIVSVLIGLRYGSGRSTLPEDDR